MRNISRAEGYLAGLTAFMMLAIAHAWLVWGYSSVFWGDAGRWLHEIDRFANGEVLYRDFVWPFPPLAMWLFGGVARLINSDVAVVWSSTTGVYLALCAAYYHYVRCLVPPRLRSLVLLVGFLLAVAYANTGGNPLPLGTYSPAAPLGALLLLLAVLSAVSLKTSLRSGTAALVGLLCGLCILSKQDFWLPAGYVVALSSTLLLMQGRRTAAVATSSAFVLTIGSASAVVIAQSGLDALPGVISGFGHVQEFGGLGLPSWERLTVELLVSCWILVLVASSATLVLPPKERRRALKWTGLLATCGILAMALHVGMTLRTGAMLTATGLPEVPSHLQRNLWWHVEAGSPLWRPALGLLRSAIEAHLLPILLPVILIVTIGIRWRTLPRTPLRSWALAFLGFCLAARMRRLFQGVDWFHFLLEIPVYTLVLELFVGSTARQLRKLATLILIPTLAVSVHAYWGFGRGPLTRAGTLPEVVTPRGIVHMPADEAADFYWLIGVLDRVDPGRERPIFAFGFTGGFSYFLSRGNPSPTTLGFRLSRWPGDSVVASISASDPAPFLLDTHAYDSIGTPALGIDLKRWEQRLVRNHLIRVDRPYFERLLAGCHEISRRPDTRAPFFVLFDCG